jgi:hypothetical protein
MLFQFLFVSILSMAATERTQSELLLETGIDAKTLARGTEASLESFLFVDENGMSCGLKEFSMEIFTATGKPGDTYNSFVVASMVKGPVGQTCGIYDEYMCYTTWENTSSGWQAAGSECDEDTVFGE